MHLWRLLVHRRKATDLVDSLWVEEKWAYRAALNLFSEQQQVGFQTQRLLGTEVMRNENRPLLMLAVEAMRLLANPVAAGEVGEAS